MRSYRLHKQHCTNVFAQCIVNSVVCTVSGWFISLRQIDMKKKYIFFGHLVMLIMLSGWYYSFLILKSLDMTFAQPFDLAQNVIAIYCKLSKRLCFSGKILTTIIVVSRCPLRCIWQRTHSALNLWPRSYTIFRTLAGFSSQPFELPTDGKPSAADWIKALLWPCTIALFKIAKKTFEYFSFAKVIMQRRNINEHIMGHKVWCMKVYVS